MITILSKLFLVLTSEKLPSYTLKSIKSGAYTKEEKIMLSSICSPRQSAMIRKYLAEHFPRAFMEVAPIVTVYGIGERFVRIKGED